MHVGLYSDAMELCYALSRCMCLSVSFCLSVHSANRSLSVRLIFCQSAHLTLCLYGNLFICQSLSVSLLICQYACLSICLLICQSFSVCLLIVWPCLSLGLPICQSLSVCPPVYVVPRESVLASRLAKRRLAILLCSAVTVNCNRKEMEFNYYSIS